MTYQPVPKKSDGPNPQLMLSLKKKERNVPLLEGSTNQNLKLNYTPKESVVLLKHGQGQMRVAKTIAKSASGVTLEKT